MFDFAHIGDCWWGAAEESAGTNNPFFGKYIVLTKGIKANASGSAPEAYGSGGRMQQQFVNGVK